MAGAFSPLAFSSLAFNTSGGASVGTAEGAATVAGVGLAIVSGTGEAAGASAAHGAGSSIATATGSAQGKSTAEAIPAGGPASIGTAAGTSTANAIGKALRVASPRMTRTAPARVRMLIAPVRRRMA